MSKKNAIIKGTFILTVTGLTTRFLGFFYRVFLSHNFGEEGVGLYQLIFPVYALCYSFAVAGIEISLSRIVAGKIALGKYKEANETLRAALLLSLLLSFSMILLLQQNSEFIATTLLGDIRCQPLLIAMSYAFPFCALHSCICGYYIGFKDTKVTAIAQLIEQVSRVAFVYVLVQFAARQKIEITISMAVLGLVSGEVFSSVFCIFALRHTEKRSISHKTPFLSYLSRLKELLPSTIPLTGNRVLLNILQSIEAVSIPRFLQVYGANTSEALSTYGVLTGMALPLILFPSAITNSISMMMLPTFAEMQTAGSREQMKSMIKKVAFSCFLLGSGCLAIFLVFGHFVGDVLFHSESAGDFIVTLSWICPFLYTNTTLISMLNGMDKAHITFSINSTGLLLRVASVFFLIPVFGIIGYLWGLLLSQLLVTLLCIWQLHRCLNSRS